MTPTEIAAWGGFAVLVIGAMGGQTVLVIREFRYARKRQYALHEAVQSVGLKAEDAYQEANHVNVKITDLNKRLVEQGRLAEQASDALPHLQQTTDETKAAVETAAASTEETKQLAKDIHKHLEP